MHRLPMLRRSKRSHVDGCVDISATFSLASGVDSQQSPLANEKHERMFMELIHRIVLCESPLCRNEAGVWDCSVSKWAHTLLTNAVLATGLSPCRTLACELSCLASCDKVRDSARARACVCVCVCLGGVEVCVCHAHAHARACTHTRTHTRTQTCTCVPSHTWHHFHTEPGHAQRDHWEGDQRALEATSRRD